MIPKNFEALGPDSQTRSLTFSFVDPRFCDFLLRHRCGEDSEFRVGRPRSTDIGYLLVEPKLRRKGIDGPYCIEPRQPHEPTGK